MKKRVMDEHGNFVSIDKLPRDQRIEIETNSKRITAIQKKDMVNTDKQVINKLHEENAALKNSNEELASANTLMMKKMNEVIAKMEERESAPAKTSKKKDSKKVSKKVVKEDTTDDVETDTTEVPEDL